MASTANYSTGTGARQRGEATEASDVGPTTQGVTISRMAADNHQLGLDRSTGKKSSRSSKRGTNAAAGVPIGREKSNERDAAMDGLPPGGAGPDGNLPRGAYPLAAASISQKKYLLKKNQFESEIGLSTGRFEDGGNAGGHTKEQFSKSANHAKVLRIINAESLVPTATTEDAPGISKQIGRVVGDSTTARATGPEGTADGAAVPLPDGFDDGQHHSAEQEMRETSYFKQQTDDEGAQAAPK